MEAGGEGGGAGQIGVAVGVGDAALDPGPGAARLETARVRRFADGMVWMSHLKALGIMDLKVQPEPATKTRASPALRRYLHYAHRLRLNGHLATLFLIGDSDLMYCAIALRSSPLRWLNPSSIASAMRLSAAS